MFQVVHIAILFFSLLVAPAVLVAAYFYKRQFKLVQLRWKSSQVTLLTILAFILNFFFFGVFAFLLATWLGDTGKVAPAVWGMSKDQVELALMDAVLMLAGITLTYLGVRSFFLQHITADGIVTAALLHRGRLIHTSTIYWNDIADYFVNSDYPLTTYTFILRRRNDLTLERASLSVPFYILPRFDMLLENNLRKQQELRDQTRQYQRNMPSGS